MKPIEQKEMDFNCPQKFLPPQQTLFQAQNILSFSQVQGALNDLASYQKDTESIDMQIVPRRGIEAYF